MTEEDLLLAWPGQASSWIEAAPVGNGRLGAMVFGGAAGARVQLNDATVWSGTPAGPSDALAAVLAAGAGPERLDRVRDAIRAGDHGLAESLLMAFEGPYSQEFLPYADLWLSLEGEGDCLGRTLNLGNGVVTETLTAGGRPVRRRTWVSRPAAALCVAMEVDGGTVDLTVELATPLREVSRSADESGLELGIVIPVDGAPRHEEDVAEPLRYADGPVNGYDPFGAVVLKVDTDGAVVAEDGLLRLRGASRVLLTVSSSTQAEDVWTGEPPVQTRRAHGERAAARASRALALGSDRLLRDHEADLRALLGATSLTIGERRRGTVDVAADVLSGKDEHLTATVLFQFGRYLLASASRQGAPPANLQGIWNEDLRPAWSSNYTVNINTEMNYWAAETAGLGECHLPLFDLLDKLAVTGGRVACELYGARGWVTHHNTDPWGWALPVGNGHGNPSWAIWMMGGAWLVQHAWEHYDFTRDETFLRERAWPLLRGCAEFCLDWLTDGGEWAETIPGTSPENLFLTPQGKTASLTHSPSMDVSLIRAVLSRCLDAAGQLGLGDDPVCEEIRETLPRLRPLRVGDGGWLLEWAEDLPEHDPAHRHMSQMVAVYPLGHIGKLTTPELASAATKVLDRRGPGAMGWSWAWKIALRARLGDGEAARALFAEATRPFTGDTHRDAPVDGSEWGGLLPNLFSTHPPFQIDGNYGFPAALLEMVVQSQDGVLELLPALPEAWPAGEARGVRCRGGIEVDLLWREGVLGEVTVRRLAGDPGEVVRVRRGAQVTEFRLETRQERVLEAERC